MNWLSWIVVGGIAGWIASMLTRNNARMGLLANIAVGVVGGFLMDLIGASGVTGFNLWSLLVSVIGATVLLWIINLIRRR